MQTVSIVGLAYLAGFATPYAWNFITWRHSQRRKVYE